MIIMEWIKRKLSDQVKAVINDSVRQIDATIGELAIKLESIEQMQREQSEKMERVMDGEEDIESLKINIRNNNSAISLLVENIANNNQKIEYLEGFNERICALEENIRNNNEILCDLETRTDMCIAQVSTVKKNLRAWNDSNVQGESEHVDTQKSSASENTYHNIDYFALENHFRGSREHIKQVQQQYVKYFTNCQYVLDLGSGRGEFLELLKSNGVHAIGIELYDEFIELCRNKGLEVVKEDALSYLRNCKCADGIFAAQLIEHLPIDKVMELCDLAYEKLSEGAYMILETPNPTSLAIFANSFYIDPSHNKPVHPLTLKYMAEKAGFKNTTILYTDNSKLPITIPKLESRETDKLAEFNQSMSIVSNLLFGSQDYALIARK